MGVDVLVRGWATVGAWVPLGRAAKVRATALSTGPGWGSGVDVLVWGWKSVGARVPVGRVGKVCESAFGNKTSRRTKTIGCAQPARRIARVTSSMNACFIFRPFPAPSGRIFKTRDLPRKYYIKLLGKNQVDLL
jgi:hypothetical protein